MALSDMLPGSTASKDSVEEPKPFKEQLDQAANDRRSGSNKPNPVVQKITEYVPAAAKVLGQQSDPNDTNKPEIPGPPERPHHDDKIEDFVRDQHRSNGTDGILGGDGK
ncbi:hypothetical protein B0T10DRAFT_267911 [Thelonectria olida]|uniref:Uncharacterized protein n=1 Tax=Thelonectria olida TaxID=1576542 RepID=A0A9P8W8M4_9HYPO|nr:hypothetical protein B0T10DRAFT_267911 [Thelonectria olida]